MLTSLRFFTHRCVWADDVLDCAFFNVFQFKLGHSEASLSPQDLAAKARVGIAPLSSLRTTKDS